MLPATMIAMAIQNSTKMRTNRLCIRAYFGAQVSV